MKKLFVTAIALAMTGCATLTSDAMTPIAISFGDGSNGKCELTNKRGAWTTKVPTTIPIRRSDDALKYQCETDDGRKAVGSIASTVGAKIVASAVFIDFGITDAITDKHREYPASFVIPLESKAGNGAAGGSTGAPSQSAEDKDVYAELEKLNELREKGILTDAEFNAEKRKLLDAE